jgi:hypothetical protein
LSARATPSALEPLASVATPGIPAFACTPDRFPEVMAVAIQRTDLRDFVAKTAE